MAEEMKDDAKDENKDEAKAKDGDETGAAKDAGDDKNPFAFFGGDGDGDGDAKADADAASKADAETGDEDDDEAKADAKAPEPAEDEPKAGAGSNGETEAAAEGAAKDAPPPTAGTEELEVEPLIKADDLVPGDPDAEAPPPRKAPAGDARSLRRGEEFAFVYRDGAYLITREGKVGKNGAWSCVEYPDQGAAAHAYAMRCSELTGEGFRDLR